MKTKRFWKILYICLVLVILVVPSLGLLVFRSGEAESADSKDAPVLITEEGLNQNFLKDAGNYFEDHFALRDEMVTGYALLGANVFQTSTQPKVVAGNNGWLYYTDTLDDYQAINQLSDRQLFDIARSLKMMQDYLKSEGITMLFVMVPNKNSLYDENMPYYYLRGADEQKNLARIKPYLEAEGVNYLSLEDVLLSDDPLYMAKDSHWNNLGAALATEVILKKLSLPCKNYTSASWVTRTDYEGDLDGMIFPAAITKEAQVYTD
ncbi:MAG: hypothetical protein HUJ75_06150, partial [Parasporobacterium sp.]|nr:hypothetical protein [Parasporobacterium sp.]